MKKFINGQYVEMKEEEIQFVQTEFPDTPQLSYGERVNLEIRKRYTESDEFAILRQKDEKPEEYAEYYAYCEECKKRVKESQ